VWLSTWSVFAASALVQFAAASCGISLVHRQRLLARGRDASGTSTRGCSGGGIFSYRMARSSLRTGIRKAGGGTLSSVLLVAILAGRALTARFWLLCLSVRPGPKARFRAEAVGQAHQCADPTPGNATLCWRGLGMGETGEPHLEE
jgi:hypothetical protein